MEIRKDRAQLFDCILLATLILLSTLPYVFHLGFYSDDWAYQSVLVHSSGQGIVAMVQQVVAWDPTVVVRPFQIAYLVSTFEAFGRHATPYHLLDSAVLSCLTIFLYLALKEIHADRWLAFSIALVFGLLPHYSTDRIWIVAHQATFSMAFAVFGIYALLRSNRSSEANPAKWVVASVLSLLLSLLSYEVALGLIVVTLGTIGIRKYIKARQQGKFVLTGMGGVAVTVTALLLVGILKSLLQTRMVIPLRFPRHFSEHIEHILVQSVRFLFWTYGLHMPVVLACLFRRGALNIGALVVAAVITLAVAGYLWHFMASSTIPSRRNCLLLIAAGFVLFGLGCALFFTDNTFNFSSAGIANRTAIASALGASCVLTAVIGLLSSLPRLERVRVRTFGVLLGLVCGINSLVVSGIGFYWARAQSEQSAILQTVARNRHPMPEGSVLLLDGFCRYTGPGIVFEDDWDTSAAVQLALDDPSLRSDVISRNMQFGEKGINTSMYGQPEAHYVYGDRLFLYNLHRGVFLNLTSREVAIAYLHRMNPSQDSGCPESEEGDGEKIF